LASIVQTNLESYKKTGNMEAMWEDLIFMNYMLHFKNVIKNNKDLCMDDICNYEYGVHIPNI
jgi:hypothetical protein